jgi:flagellar motor switch protein FliN
MTQAPPMYWLKQIHEDLLESKTIPLWGSAPDFPWESFEASLKKLLEVDDFKVSLLPTESSEGDLLEPFGMNPKKLSFQLSPLTEKLTWVLSSESVAEISSLMLNKGEGIGEFNPEFQEGYYQFLLLRVCKEIEELGIYPSLHIQWSSEEPIQEGSFFIDVSIALYGKSFTGRLIIPPSFQKAFSSHFMQESFDLSSAPLTSTIAVPLRLEAGSSQVTQSEWNSIEEGDCLILDRCTYNPETEKGVLDLTWDKSPLFKVKMKKNSLQILDYAVYQGDSNTMPDQFTEDSFNVDGEELQQRIENLKTPEEGEAPSEESLIATEEEAAAEAIAEELPVSEEVGEGDTPTPVETAPSDSIVPVKDVPFSVVVEVDRIKISLEKLLQLKPGNVLELPVRPEQGVSLTVHGKKVARGELLKIGDMLGVKIIEIGNENGS